ncbi:LysR family transcriptional regulator [Paenibacillus kribbensis]|uniref:LysR family transcriptional regulator n=1 Tax=Paenibacillus kribbensis TaxID=172713 RepID=UPI000839AD0A|nr:LysR family transcriptional regulator [Paenibacillus kribbensis]
MINSLEGRFFLAFITSLEEKSFSRAADRLGYVQSTVTTHIQQLEKICRQKLFHRYPRGIELTEAGKVFSKYAYQYVHLSQSLKESMDELDQPCGTVRIRTQESFFLTRMLPFVQEYTRNYPSVNLRIEQGAHQDILKGVLDYELDFGIVPQNPSRHDIIFYPIIEETIVFVASEDIAQKVSNEGVRILNDQLFISSGTSCLYHTSAIDVLKNAGIMVKDAIELPSLEMIKQYVSCGKGFALVPEIAVNNELKTGKLNIIPFDSQISFTHGLIIHKNRECSFTAKKFQSELMCFLTDI